MKLSTSRIREIRNECRLIAADLESLREELEEVMRDRRSPEAVDMAVLERMEQFVWEQKPMLERWT